MLVAHPTFGRWTFDLYRQEGAGRSPKVRPLARIALRHRDEGLITVGDTPFALGSDRQKRYVILFEGVEVARATQPKALERRLHVLVQGTMLDRHHAITDAADVALVLRAAHPFTRVFTVAEGEQAVGEVRPAHPFTRRSEIDLPDYLPLAVQAFLFALVAVQWRRAARRSG